MVRTGPIRIRSSSRPRSESCTLVSRRSVVSIEACRMIRLARNAGSPALRPSRLSLRPRVRSTALRRQAAATETSAAPEVSDSSHDPRGRKHCLHAPISVPRSPGPTPPSVDASRPAAAPLGASRLRFTSARRGITSVLEATRLPSRWTGDCGQASLTRRPEWFIRPAHSLRQRKCLDKHDCRHG